MIQSIPQIGISPPKLLGTFKCLTPIVIQVTGPDTLYLAETNNALSQENDFGVIDALMINLASGIIKLWWIGDLWAAGSDAFQCIIGIPGVNTGSGLAGSSLDPSNVLNPSSGGTL